MKHLHFHALALLSLSLSPLLSTAQAGWIKNLPALSRSPGTAPWLRTALHVHSVHSHDACDKKPNRDGLINQRCLNDFRTAFCKNHYDVVFVTEHRDDMAYIPFKDVLPTSLGDQDLYEQGTWVGKRHRCDDGHQVTYLVGSENELMPLGLVRHPEVLPGKNLEQTYNAYSPEAAQVMRDAGAIVGVSHLESRGHTIESLKAIRPEVVEAYNLHANLKWIYEGKKVFRILKYLGRFLAFLGSPWMEPDLVFLAFFREDETTWLRYAQLAASHEVNGVFGVDSHQNALKTKMFDGERIDSYRRTTRWFSNWVRQQPEMAASQSFIRQSMLNALSNGPTIGVLEVIGQPEGFDYFVDGNNKLTVVPPKVLPSATKVQILKATEKGWVVVAQTENKLLEYQPTTPGAYLAQLRTKPSHLRKYMRGMAHVIREMPWVVSSPIYIKD